MKLNYHHLLYFRTVAREGGVARAAEHLHRSAAAISGQVRSFERSLGQRLFQRRGRGLELTEAGRLAFAYADEIFRLGGELEEGLAGRAAGRPLRLVVGVDQVLPKLAIKRLLEPALAMPEPLRLICLEDRAPALLTALAEHRLDVVLLDRPVGAGSPIRAFSHLLGDCGVSWFATPKLARAMRGRFPRRLDGAPILVPAPETALRRALDQWLQKHELHPRILAEFEDSALLKAFGQEGIGAFPGPTVLEREICKQFAVCCIGRSPEVRERFYVASVERRIKHPAVLAIREGARQEFHA